MAQANWSISTSLSSPSSSSESESESSLPVWWLPLRSGTLRDAGRLMALPSSPPLRRLSLREGARVVSWLLGVQHEV